MSDAAAEKAHAGGAHCEESSRRPLVDRNIAAIFRIRMDGRMEECNPALARMLGYPSPDEVIARPAWDCDAGNGRENLAACLFRNRDASPFEISLTGASGDPVWLRAAVVDLVRAGDSVSVRATAVDITETRRARRKIGLLNRICAMLSALHRDVADGGDSVRFCEDACRIACDTGGFAAAWIALFDSETPDPVVRGTAGHGAPLPARTTRNCPALPALRERRTFCCRDIASDPAMARFRDHAARYELRSMAALPFRARDHVAGGLWLFSSEPGIFDAEIINALEEFAFHIGFQLQSIEGKAVSAVHARAEARFRELLEAAPDAILETDRDGAIILLNAATCRMFGYERSELLGQCVDLLLPERRRPAHAAMRAAYTAEPISHTIPGAGNLRARRKDGTEFPVEISLSPVRSRSGDFVTCIIRDITHRELAEQALRESTRQISAILESIRDGFYALDRDWRFSYVNGKAEQLLARSRADLIGKVIWEEFPEQEGSVVFAEFRRAAAERTPVEFCTLLPPANLWLEIHAYPSENGLSVYFRDITERKHLEERLQQSEKLEALGRLAGGVAHDFNNLLTIIGGYGQMILEATGRRDPAYKNIAAIVEAANRASALTRQLLAFSRRQMVQPKLLDLNRVLAKMKKMLRRLIREDIELILDLERGVGHIRIDPGQLEQVILNLVVNARDAMPTGGTLTITTASHWVQANSHGNGAELPAGRYVALAVTDTGTGMDTTVLSRIFEPFFTTKAKHKGTGLGLATVYGVVKQSGGDILVDSEPGRGTTFRIFLPLEERPRRTGAPRRAAPRSHRGTETILLVEDETAVRKLASDMLSGMGYTVLEAPGGAEAIRIFQTARPTPDLLVTDVIMPQMSGPQLAENLTALQPGLKVLFVSGYTDDVVARHGIGAESVLPKPFTRTGLAAKVRSLLDQPPPK